MLDDPDSLLLSRCVQLSVVRETKLPVPARSPLSDYVICEFITLKSDAFSKVASARTAELSP